MAPIPPYVAKVTSTCRGEELHTTHGHELLTVSSRTKKAPKWSFPGKRTGSGEHPDGTEVGHYASGDPHRDINGRYKRDPAWSLQLPKGDRSSSLPPGPGRYNNRDGTLRNSAPSWSFGSTSKSADRTFLDGSVGPGPAAYAPNHAVGWRGAPAYSSAGRGNGKSHSTGPGPGHYGPPRSTLRGKVGRWGDAPWRPYSAPDDGQGGNAGDGRSPGPGFLAPSTLTGPRFSMGARREALDTMDRRLPGPRTQFGY
ncbi:unnamed protein product [Effrenium voratum]|nr:unnamed protein product [Effrenium voratum]